MLQQASRGTSDTARPHLPFGIKGLKRTACVWRIGTRSAAAGALEMRDRRRQHGVARAAASPSELAWDDHVVDGFAIEHSLHCCPSWPGTPTIHWHFAPNAGTVSMVIAHHVGIRWRGGLRSSLMRMRRFPGASSNRGVVGEAEDRDTMRLPGSSGRKRPCCQRRGLERRAVFGIDQIYRGWTIEDAMFPHTTAAYCWSPISFAKAFRQVDAVTWITRRRWHAAQRCPSRPLVRHQRALLCGSSGGPCPSGWQNTDRNLGHNGADQSMTSTPARRYTRSSVEADDHHHRAIVVPRSTAPGFAAIVSRRDWIPSRTHFYAVRKRAMKRYESTLISCPRHLYWFARETAHPRKVGDHTTKSSGTRQP